jgi:bifunctional protein folC
VSLKDYLSDKPLFYDKIDYSRFPRAFASVREAIKPREIIHIVGTNGKGSTGRFLAQILTEFGFCVGHYTSPHIFKFCERFWLKGRDVSDDELEKAHQFLQSILNDEFKSSLSYFEYATLLAAVLFRECDYVIFEAGMGSRYDATGVFDKSLSLFTPIGLDHTAFLGENIESIAQTKFYKPAKFALMNDFMDFRAVKIGREVAKEFGSNLLFAHEILDDNDKNALDEYSREFALADFMRSNLTLAYSGAKMILFLDANNRAQISPNLDEIINAKFDVNIGENLVKDSPNLKINLSENFVQVSSNLVANPTKISPNLDAILQSNFTANLDTNSPKFLSQIALDFMLNQDKISSNLVQILDKIGALKLRGRMQKIAPNIIVDVGHNAHAAHAIAQVIATQKIFIKPSNNNQISDMNKQNHVPKSVLNSHTNLKANLNENSVQILSNLDAILHTNPAQIAPNFTPSLDTIAPKISQTTANLVSNPALNHAKNSREIQSLKKPVLIYNAFIDKDIRAVLLALAPQISRVEIYEYKSDERKLAGEEIAKICAQIGLECSNFTQLNERENYLVFGSFLLVEHFLNETFKGDF